MMSEMNTFMILPGTPSFRDCGYQSKKLTQERERGYQKLHILNGK